MAACALAILLFRSHLASLFTPDPEIAAVVANVAPVVALFQVTRNIWNTPEN